MASGADFKTSNGGSDARMNGNGTAPATEVTVDDFLAMSEEERGKLTASKQKKLKKLVATRERKEAKAKAAAAKAKAGGTGEGKNKDKKKKKDKVCLKLLI